MEQKFILALKASVFTPLVWFIEKYVFNDWDMLISVVLLLFLDAFALMLRSVFDRKFTATDGFKSFALKTLAIGLTLAGLGMIDLATIKGEQSEVLGFINSGFYTVMFSFLGLSIATQAYNIYPYPPIKKLIDKLNSFNEKTNLE